MSWFSSPAAHPFLLRHCSASFLQDGQRATSFTGILLFSLGRRCDGYGLLPALTAAGVDVAPVLYRMIVQMATEHGSHFNYF